MSSKSSASLLRSIYLSFREISFMIAKPGREDTNEHSFGLGVRSLNEPTKKSELMALSHKFFKIHWDDLIKYNFTSLYIRKISIFNNNYFTKIWIFSLTFLYFVF
jgi:hypothetical protein